MSLSVIIEEPSGFQDGDLEFVGRVPHQTFGRRRPKTWGAPIGGREASKRRRGAPPAAAAPPSGRLYVRSHTARGLGGLRLGGGGGGGGAGGSSKSYSPNRPGAGTSGGLPRSTPLAPATHFARNPRHPKSMYDVEKSMRSLRTGRHPKLTPGMAFPDPRTPGAFRNPAAPRFRYEFDPRLEDYDIKRNPLADVDTAPLFAGRDATGDISRDNPAYNDSDSSSDDDSSDSQTTLATTDVDGGGINSTRGDDGDDAASSVDLPTTGGGGVSPIYSSVKKRLTRTPPAPPAAPPPPPGPKPKAKTAAAAVPLVFLPRAAVSHHRREPTPSTSFQVTPEEVEETPPPLPKPLQPLTEEEEEEDDDDDEEDPPKLPQDLRDMSTQTTVTVQSQGEPVDEEDDDQSDGGDRFVHIRDARTDDAETMTHTNWEVVAPWTDQQRRHVGTSVERSNSLAVNYRRVVAELSGSETRSEASGHQQRHHQQGDRRRPPSPSPPPSPPPLARPYSPPATMGDPPPWSPPIVPQVEQILRPTRMEGMMIDDRRMVGGELDYERRRRGRRSFAGFWNRCCLVTLMLLSVAVIICAVVVTLLYASFASKCTSNCGLVQQPAYLAGLVALGALAILTVFALMTWCCYNVTRRQGMYKYRTGDGY